MPHGMLCYENTFTPTRSDEGSFYLQEADVSMKRKLILSILLGLFIAGCAGVQHADVPEGPFAIALLVTTETRGELEPCG